MTAPLLLVEGLRKRFGGLCATDDLSLAVRPGELHALIGPNGAGKSTAIAQITGEIRPDAGRILFAGRDITRLPPSRRVRRGLSRTFQIVQLLDEATTLENVALAVQAHQGHSFRFWRDARRDERLRQPARQLLLRAGVEAALWEQRTGDLSAGARKQVELAIALAAAPRLLLLDEPMAGLGPSESRAMTETLRGLKGRLAILLVEHDMEAVFALADRVSVLVDGRCIASGEPAEIRADPAVRAAYLTEDEEA
ncbi:ABC transporter ATP-binding protein [Pseudoroseomonas rhizosphaerae]|uniref:ABC transporter ATP-binding protein n=1 Tax=Teichococcus rhizosphaerae TaxID=1335062 RepID=A0A2C6ZZT5_9PROT|nr:ABC transporter ATP-binding protein [Pseudoroseomonas rhizosphaerae]PHK93318.1 ABC transporter ATP-binding protein [Pseudoroseomonas rhizosphaerae]